LRYLVGVVCGVSDVDKLDQPFGAECMTDRAQRIMSWRENAGRLLGNTMQGKSRQVAISASEPLPFYQALHVGLTRFRLLQVRFQITDLLKATGIAPHLLRAIVAPYGNHKEELCLAVSLISKLDQSFLGVALYPVSHDEDAEDASKLFCATLTASGIADLHVIFDTVPMMSCEDCGAPLYLVPVRDEGECFELSHVGLGSAPGPGPDGASLTLH
jgi:hypothetical protein